MQENSEQMWCFCGKHTELRFGTERSPPHVQAWLFAQAVTPEPTAVTPMGYCSVLVGFLMTGVVAKGSCNVVKGMLCLSTAPRADLQCSTSKCAFSWNTSLTLCCLLGQGSRAGYPVCHREFSSALGPAYLLLCALSACSKYPAKHIR